MSKPITVSEFKSAVDAAANMLREGEHCGHESWLLVQVLQRGSECWERTQYGVLPEVYESWEDYLNRTKYLDNVRPFVLSFRLKEDGAHVD